MYLVDDLCRLRMLIAGVYVGISISSKYAFSVFTEYLKHRYHFTQSEITTISTVGNCINNLSFFAGMLFDYAGPMVVLPFAGFLGSTGFLLYGLTFAGYVSNPTYVKFAVYQGLIQYGITSMDVGSLMPLMLQFPLDRGLVVFIQKTFGGLGTSVLMAYFNGWFKSHTSDASESNNYTAFAFFVAAQCVVSAAVGTYFIRMPAYFPCAWRKKRLSAEEWSEREATSKIYMKQNASHRRLMIGVALTVLLLIFSTTQSICTAYIKTPPSVYLAISIVAVLLMVAFTIPALPFQFLGRYTSVRPTHIGTIGEIVENGEGEKKNPEGSENIDPVANKENEIKYSVPQYRGSFWRHVLSVPLWCLWLTCFGTLGTGTVMQTNAAQFYSSKSYGVVHTPTLVMYITIMSVGNAVGRMAMGITDMYLIRWQRAGKTKMLITIVLPLGPFMLVLAYLLFAILPQGGLILPFFLGSVGNGMGYGGTVLATRMMYARDAGKHYDFTFSSAFVATIALNRFMFGEMYDHYARKLGTLPKCPQPSCITNQMWILFAVNIVATVAGFVVHWIFTRYVEAERCKELQALSTAKPSADAIDAIAKDAPLSETKPTHEPAETALPVPSGENAPVIENWK